MRFKTILVMVVLLVSSCSITQKQTTTPPRDTAVSKRNSYFIEAPITKLSSIDCPCIDVEIDSKQLSMELDLGFRGDLSIEEDHIDLVSEKSFISERIIHGIRGKQYSVKVYRVPKAKIGKMTFIQPRLEEGSREFTKNSTFVQNGGEPSPREPGRLGWELFYNVNLLIDIKNSKIAFCDNLNTLRERGYDVDSFISTPLFLEQGMVEFDTETPAGPLRCMLDTGATWNFLNTEIEEGRIFDQVVWDPENVLDYTHFKIDGKDFGPIAFHRIPIKIPVHIEAILGMEFFQDTLVFLDFSNKTAYFAKDHQMTSKLPKATTDNHELQQTQIP